MGQNGTTHEDSNLLDDFYACVSRLPRFLRLAHGLEERQQRGYAQRRRDHSESTRGRVAHVLVQIVDIGTHGRDHGGQAGCFGQIRYDLATFHASIVVLVDEQRFDDHEYLVHVGADEIVQFVENTIDYFNLCK